MHSFLPSPPTSAFEEGPLFSPDAVTTRIETGGLRTQVVGTFVRTARGCDAAARQRWIEPRLFHREAMAIYLRLGMIEDARKQYQRMEQVLNDTLKIGPSRESRDLYAMIEAQS